MMNGTGSRSRRSFPVAAVWITAKALLSRASAPRRLRRRERRPARRSWASPMSRLGSLAVPTRRRRLDVLTPIRTETRCSRSHRFSPPVSWSGLRSSLAAMTKSHRPARPRRWGPPAGRTWTARVGTAAPSRPAEAAPVPTPVGVTSTAPTGRAARAMCATSPVAVTLTVSPANAAGAIVPSASTEAVAASWRR